MTYRLSASSCAVENDKGEIRLTMNFMSFGEYNAAHKTIKCREKLFKIDNRDPREGGTSGGSRLVVLLNKDFVKAAEEVLAGFEIRRKPEYINSTRTPCDTIAEAIQLACTHS